MQYIHRGGIIRICQEGRAMSAKGGIRGLFVHVRGLIVIAYCAFGVLAHISMYRYRI
jgi:hypothetical protein